jgi:hypothetical protein
MLLQMTQFDTPPPEHIRELLGQVEFALQQNPMMNPILCDQIIAALEATNLSFIDWVHRYIGDFEPNDIIKMGAELSSLSDTLEYAADALHKDEDVNSALGYIWPTMATMKKIWTEMDNRGL